MNTDSTSLANDEIELEIAMRNEHSHSKKFRDRVEGAGRKKQASKKARKKGHDVFDDDDYNDDGYNNDYHN
ncbi:hypothetical protein GCM10009111_15110 [Colwellia asteriadis]|uniref:Uncharacterized protein n=2 Tax=Colwellia TaxID=28228 RepID=A0ABN1L626_9GAMM